jgi:hypothetical protein
MCINASRILERIKWRESGDEACEVKRQRSKKQRTVLELVIFSANALKSEL